MANNETREAWLKDLWVEITTKIIDGGVEDATPEMFATVVTRVLTEGPALGRTARWQSAIRWHEEAMLEDPENDKLVRWVATQGNVWLVHAL